MKHRVNHPVRTLHSRSLAVLLRYPPKSVSFFFKLLVVMDRIRGFPLSSPISKLLNGLEILLAKAQVRLFLFLVLVFDILTKFLF